MLTDEQIVKMFWEGHSIEWLSNATRSKDVPGYKTLREARGVVERAVYEEYMRMKRGKRNNELAKTD